MAAGGDHMRCRGEGGGELQGEKESDKVEWRVEGGECEVTRGEEVNSDECSFSGWMLKSPRTTSGVPSSGEHLSRVSISSKKSQRGPGG